ncbi:MAG: phosphate/phosphite/phosphonate ABC transporter substrate-binding protein [Steroidobacteraceae bacterium]|jgi:ABC-type phosphate/phosphonate transport system substrate-binding protein
MSTQWIAALPMYDFPDLTAAHDAWWLAVAERLSGAGIADVPRHLTRDLSHTDSWRHPRLLLGQACEYPLAKSFHAYVRPLATPHYSAPGCDGPRYRSAIVVRRDDAAASLADLRNRRCVINEPTSNSGMNLLRAAIARIAGGRRFFDSVTASGSHWNSARMVADGRGDVAALDCVSYAHLHRCDAALVAQLRILDWTPASPSLPLISSRAIDERTRQALIGALGAVLADPRLKKVCASLLLAGFDFRVDESYREVLDHERRAEELGYPILT